MLPPRLRGNPVLSRYARLYKAPSPPAPAVTRSVSGPRPTGSRPPRSGSRASSRGRDLVDVLLKEGLAYRDEERGYVVLKRPDAFKILEGRRASRSRPKPASVSLEELERRRWGRRVERAASFAYTSTPGSAILDNVHSQDTLNKWMEQWVQKLVSEGYSEKSARSMAANMLGGDFREDFEAAVKHMMNEMGPGSYVYTWYGEGGWHVTVFNPRTGRKKSLNLKEFASNWEPDFVTVWD
ncbi:hypothetical protein [Aeropyrum pernix]|uniref:hypothetical protein n=1 Tax=Aeropyrum pernix TaxID=56636 RepID=UPI00103807C8|nr:hypothetical protein [Aeropyrum pernix]